MKKGVKTKKAGAAAKEKAVAPRLRQRALERMKRGCTDISEMQAEEVEELVQELQIHQVELEIQNEDLRLAQVELAEARDMYLDLYESAPVGCLTIGGDRLIRQANLTAASQLGLERSRLVGTRLSRYATREHTDDIYLAMEEARNSGLRQSCEVEFQRPDGSSFPGWVQIVPTEGAGEFRVMISDVTEKKEADRQRDDTLAMLDLLYRTAPVGLCVFDRELRYVRVNARLAEMNGMTVEEHIGKTPKEVVPDFEEQVEKVSAHIFRTGEPVLDREFAGRTSADPGRKRVWIEDWWPLANPQNEVVGISVVVKDISELKEAEEELEALNRDLEQRVEERTRQYRESRERYRSRIDSIPHMVWSLLADGTGEYCDRQTLEYLGLTVEEIREWDWREALHPEDRERVDAEFAEMLRTGAEGRTEVRIRRGRDGACRWHSAHVVPMRDDEGRVVRWLGTCTDIHERKVALQGLAQMSRVFQDAALPILITDGGACIVEANKEVERNLGWTAGELSGKSVKTVLAPSWYDEFDRLLEATLRNEEGGSEETVLLTKKGTRVPALVSMSLLSVEQEEETVRVALIARDISWIKSTEAALKSSEKALREEKKKLEDKNTALREILDQVEGDKSKIRQEVAAHIAEFVLPALDRLAGSGPNHPSLLAALRDAVADLSSPLGQPLQAGVPGLTAREKEICRMLKGGLSSKEISRILECSAQTVEKHRKNIRRKLGIAGTGTNLGTYLNGR